MSGRTQQYTDFSKLVNIPKSVQEEKKVKNYWLTVNILKLITIGALGFQIISTILDLKIKKYVFITAVVFVVIYIWYRSWFAKQFRNILLKDCDPVRGLALYGNLVSYTKRQSNWELHFYNLASLLYYAGRFDDVIRVQSLLQKYCPGNLGQLYYEMIETELALYKMNIEEVEKHCANMQRLSKSVHLKGIIQLLYFQKMQYPVLMQMRNRGEYTELYDKIKQAVSAQRSLLIEVKQNYYLYKIASVLGDEEKMEEHGKFIIQRGGTLWYRQEIEKIE